MIKKYALLLGF